MNGALAEQEERKFKRGMNRKQANEIPYIKCLALNIYNQYSLYISFTSTFLSTAR